jgi:hypothetical protein
VLAGLDQGEKPGRSGSDKGDRGMNRLCKSARLARPFGRTHEAARVYRGSRWRSGVAGAGARTAVRADAAHRRAHESRSR